MNLQLTVQAGAARIREQKCRRTAAGCCIENSKLWSLAVALCLTTIATSAQEGAVQSDFRREGERLGEACAGFALKTAPVCAIELFTDSPFHIAAGSMPPQNGFGLGGAFVARYTPNKDWRFSSNLDAVGSTTGAWRAGAYLRFIHTPVVRISVAARLGQTKGKLVHPYTVFNLYAQSINLPKLTFFGLGNTTAPTDRSYFGMRETIVGASAIKPVSELWVIRALNLSLLAEINGRFVSLSGNHGQSSPSIEQIYTEAEAPGMATQPIFVQFGQGLRVKPAVFGDHVQLSYEGNFQEFVAPSNSHYSFTRWTVDLQHTIPLYRYTQSYAARDTNGPDECATGVGANNCPPVSLSRNLDGAIGLRLLLSESIHSATSAVPFYFQQTLGGQDVNNQLSLGSYQDYRFRAPNLLAVQGYVEHSVWGPVGLKFVADQGRVALTRGDIGFSHLRHSFGAALTLRAGGFPFVQMMFSWGGPEGHHNIFNMSSSLLGGSSRPLLD